MAAGIRIVYEFPYRAEPAHETGQGWHFDDFADDADFVATATQLATRLVEVLDPDCAVKYAYGYHNFSPGHAHDYYVAFDGSMAPAFVGLFTPDVSDIACPGDDAVWVRWYTGRKTSKGKPVYLRKYFHRAWRSPADPADAIAVDYATALQSFGDAMLGGIEGHVMQDPEGRTISGPAETSAWITTRTLKRRGRRPPPP